MNARVALANAAENVQSRRKGYWQSYEEGKREYPADVFPRAVNGCGDSSQARKVYPQCGWQSRELAPRCCDKIVISVIDSSYATEMRRMTRS